MKRRLSCWLAAVVIFSAPFAVTLAAEEGERKFVDSGVWIENTASQTVFFAVLEGLYTDGVTNEVVDCILSPDPKSGEPRYNEHFVYACPLCHPAYEAFRLYRARPTFYGLKGEPDTFPGRFPAEVVMKLHSDRIEDRLPAIQTLIEGWVRRYLDKMRLTPEEREQVTAHMKLGRDRGMKMLETNREKGFSFNAKTCAICEGSFGACAIKPAND